MEILKGIAQKVHYSTSVSGGGTVVNGNGSVDIHTEQLITICINNRIIQIEEMPLTIQENDKLIVILKNNNVIAWNNLTKNIHTSLPTNKYLITFIISLLVAIPLYIYTFFNIFTNNTAISPIVFIFIIVSLILLMVSMVIMLRIINKNLAINKSIEIDNIDD